MTSALRWPAPTMRFFLPSPVDAAFLSEYILISFL